MAFTTRLLTAALLAGAVCMTGYAQSAPSQKRGEAIYFAIPGSALDSAEVRIKGMDVKLPARTFPCASCHGRRGGGNDERGVTPSNLARATLMQPSTVSGQRVRERPAYNLASFKTAVRAGRDPGGRDLAEAMPRFDLTDRQLADIWAFLDVLEDVAEHGVRDGEVHVGVDVDLSGPQTSVGRAQRALLEALSADINRLGGIHGRELVFHFHDTSGPAREAVDVLAELRLARRSTADYGAATPAIAAGGVAAVSSNTFLMSAGPAEQSAALRLFAVEEWGTVGVSDACDTKPSNVVLIQSARCLPRAPPTARLLVPQSVFAQIPPEQRRTLPTTTWIAMPAPLVRIAPGAQAAFARTRARTNNSRETIVAEAEAYSAGVVLVEALMKTGRSLSRDAFVSSLETLTAFEGAMTPPLTFGPNRRLGSRAVEVVQYDAVTGKFAVSGTWIDPDAPRN